MTTLVHLSKDGNFQTRTEATVVGCNVVDENEIIGEVVVELQVDVTSMHPQGGGQPTDIGTITLLCEPHTTAKISKVTLDRSSGIVTHTGVIGLNSFDGKEPFPLQSKVEVSADAENRQLLSECHSAGHVVDLAMERTGAQMPPIKGYHFVQGPYVEYKGSIEAKEREDFLSRLREAFAAIIEEEIELNIETVTVEEADKLCNRRAQNFNVKEFIDEGEPNPTVRVVSVGDDITCPCGGTHIKSTGELKRRSWGVKGLKCKKGVVRVRYGPSE